MLRITDNVHNMQVDINASIGLELKLNVTSKGKVWSAIGDHLFKFGTKKECGDTLFVTTEQFEFLQLLFTKCSYKDFYYL
jgi:hypothetical protein